MTIATTEFQADARSRRAVQTAQRLRGYLSRDSIVDQPDALCAYTCDKSQLGSFVPDVAVLPSSEEEVSAALRIASEENWFVTPRGAGSGLTGGALAVEGGIVLSLERMNRILDIGDATRSAIVEAGVITGDLVDAVESRGLYYPPAPNSMRLSTIGGNIAHDSSGPRSFKHGSIRQFLLGTRVALVGGDVHATGTLQARTFASYDLTQLLCGSEGTLGVVTRASLKLLPLPQARVTVVLELSNIAPAVALASRLVASGLNLVALDLIGASCSSELQTAGAYRFKTDDPYVLLLEVEGSEQAVAETTTGIRALCDSFAMAAQYEVRQADEQRRIWQARRLVFSAMLKAYPGLMIEDVSLPVAELPAIIAGLQAGERKHGVRWAALGNIGEGNLHVGVLLEGRTGDQAARGREFLADLLQLSMQRGGNVSFEHGIGYKKRSSYEQYSDPGALSLQRRMKAAFDPKGLLNPSKIFAPTERPGART